MREQRTKQTERPARSPEESQIPQFQSYEEEAKFWDTHDFTEFADELRPVKARFAKNLTATLNIRLDQATLERLRRQARQRGVGPTTLARMWLLEQLQKIEQPS